MLRRSIGQLERQCPLNRSLTASRNVRRISLQDDEYRSSGSRNFHISSPSSSRKAELNKLERRTLAEINLLKQRMEDDDKLQYSNESSANLPELTEETLELLYEALNTPEPLTEEEKRDEERRRNRLIPSQEDENRVYLLEKRLADIQSRIEEVRLISTSAEEDEANQDQHKRLIDIIQTREKESNMEENLSDVVSTQTSTSALSHSNEAPSLEHMLSQIEETLNALSQKETSISHIPLGILSLRDWSTLSQKAALSDDKQSIIQILRLMNGCGQAHMRLKVMNTALEIFAKKGEVSTCQALTKLMEKNGIELNTFSTHCLITAYVKEDRLDEAAAILKHLQDVQPASMATYHLLIQRYLQKTSQPHIQSKVWTIFKEMRMSAHPIPDAIMYAQMIRACGLGIPQPNDSLWKPDSTLLAEVNTIRGKARELKPGRPQRPDTERALDLFREMTLRYNVRPTPEVYSAIIFACAKRKDMYEKGIEFFQNMLQIERERIAAIETSKQEDDEISISFAPNRSTYNAILQGCSQKGDLLRARWILAEMLRSSLALWTSLKARKNVSDWEWAEVEARRPDENTLSLIFFTYALYKLPKRTTLKSVASDHSSSQTTTSADQTSTEVSSNESSTRSTEDEDAFTERLPQTSAEVVKEVNGLLERVSADAEIEGGLLSAVIPDTRMLNAYLTVLSEHCEESKRLQLLEIALFGSNSSDSLNPVLNGKSIFERWSLPINGYTCEVVLDACFKTKDRTVADELSGKIWQHWQTLTLQNSKGDGMEIKGVKSDENKLGIDPIRISRCWASMIRNTAKSYRIEEAMELLRSFVNQFPPSSVQSSFPFQQPALTFQQIELLHNRLVLTTSIEPQQRQKDLKFLTWAVKAYEANLKPKRPAVLKPFSSPYRTRRNSMIR